MLVPDADERNGAVAGRRQQAAAPLAIVIGELMLALTPLDVLSVPPPVKDPAGGIDRDAAGAVSAGGAGAEEDAAAVEGPSPGSRTRCSSSPQPCRR